MSGWDVMAGPLSTLWRVAVVVAVLIWLRNRWRGRTTVRSTRLERAPRGDLVDLAARRHRRTRSARDADIVAAYNDALLAGCPAGEGDTFDRVADRVGTSAEHVRAVIARHWAA